MKLRVDLNADLGEGSPNESQLLALVSSANIATGFHAGDPSTMAASIRAAAGAGVAIGAHPSFADRKNFGRAEMSLAPEQVYALVAFQVGGFYAIANSLGAEMRHVKPHGALYNMAARDRELADAVVHAVLAVDSRLVLFAPSRSELANAGAAAGLSVAHEVFADRNYLPDGALVPRTRPDALLHDAREAARRVLRMLHENVVRAIDGSDVPVEAETICLHGDGAEAVSFARALRKELEGSGVVVASRRS